MLRGIKLGLILLFPILGLTDVLETDEQTLKLIIDGLQQSRQFDVRSGKSVKVLLNNQTGVHVVIMKNFLIELLTFEIRFECLHLSTFIFCTKKEVKRFTVKVHHVTSLIRDLLDAVLLYTGFEKPIFKTAVRSINELMNGQTVTGVVRNTTSFGSFVDIGVNSDGLIHRSNIPSGVNLCPRDRVECIVLKIEISSQRISLKCIKVMSKKLALC